MPLSIYLFILRQSCYRW